jgi:hypothetical protein
VPTKRKKKASSTKSVTGTIWAEHGWNVVKGELKRGPGRPTKITPLFQFVAEKLPFASLEETKKKLRSEGIEANGIYIAHDSMGTPRYVGRGAIFTRLKAHLDAHSRELAYFSFFVVKEKAHEREVETLLIRAAGDSLQFNSRKKRIGIDPGDVRDFEPGTKFFERQLKRGKK